MMIKICCGWEVQPPEKLTMSDLPFIQGRDEGLKSIGCIMAQKSEEGFRKISIYPEREVGPRSSKVHRGLSSCRPFQRTCGVYGIRCATGC